MPKHRKSRKLMSRKNQKGGLWGFFEGSSDPNAPKKSWFDWGTDSTSSAVSGTENFLGSSANAVSSGFTSATDYVKNIGSSDVNVSAPQTNNSVVVGGRRRRRMRGGKGELGLTYYATPVQNANVAEPTYWIKSENMHGGARRRKSRKTRKIRKTRKSNRRY